MITPLAPLDPYIAVAEASLRTSIDSISPGANKLGAVEIGIPSTTYNGSFPALIERVPRIRIDGVDPGVQLVFCINTPGTLP